jgi:hypothetical protein
MVGGELPRDATTVHVRVRWARGQVETGQFADIAYPSGSMDANPRQKVGRRAAPIETTALVLEPDSNPQKDPEAPPPKASFEAEIALPRLPPGGAYELHVSVGIARRAGETDAPGVDPNRYETWTPVPDLDPPEPEPADPDDPEPPTKPPR